MSRVPVSPWKVKYMEPQDRYSLKKRAFIYFCLGRGPQSYGSSCSHLHLGRTCWNNGCPWDWRDTLLRGRRGSQLSLAPPCETQLSSAVTSQTQPHEMKSSQCIRWFHRCERCMNLRCMVAYKTIIQFSERDFMSPNNIICIFLIFEDLGKAWSVSLEKGDSICPKFIEHFRAPWFWLKADTWIRLLTGNVCSKWLAPDPDT